MNWNLVALGAAILAFIGIVLWMVIDARRKTSVKAQTGPSFVPSDVALLARALRPLIEFQTGRNPGASGEYKRHQVYADAIKRFPEATHRDIGLAIELAIRDDIRL